ncbi:MAG: hypothetical protein FJ035_06495 [Chloroflexi bacterium]|nr:hypothetical protein [Chloroflexota bacterium]
MAARAVPIVVLAVHLGLGVVRYAAGGLIALPSGVLLLMAVWLSLGALGVWRAIRRPRWTWLAPALAAVA